MVMELSLKLYSFLAIRVLEPSVTQRSSTLMETVFLISLHLQHHMGGMLTRLAATGMELKAMLSITIKVEQGFSA
ncbi:hypothetical protein SKA53_00654 [Yoonia vestfoldensis SKA53]|uniref:Uncharacterized protein n=1 Tax=Yoonia vestfoldensis SKA53 TaxID=314232 RepID=A3V899_9RHOB|nr:hypothetical protein SKA53_00654 [Yoonia vestfoldensis SKA53]